MEKQIRPLALPTEFMILESGIKFRNSWPLQPKIMNEEAYFSNFYSIQHFLLHMNKNGSLFQTAINARKSDMFNMVQL